MTFKYGILLTVIKKYVSNKKREGHEKVENNTVNKTRNRNPRKVKETSKQ